MSDEIGSAIGFLLIVVFLCILVGLGVASCERNHFQDKAVELGYAEFTPERVSKFQWISPEDFCKEHCNAEMAVADR